MIERGRDALVQAMVMRWMRRVAGHSSSTPPRNRDEIFPGRVFNPIIPGTGTASEPPIDPQGQNFSVGPNTVDPGGPSVPPLPGLPVIPGLTTVDPGGPSVPPLPGLPVIPGLTTVDPGGPSVPPLPGLPAIPGLTTVDPGGPGVPPLPSVPVVPQPIAGESWVNVPDDATIAAAVEELVKLNRVVEHEQDDLQPVLRFGANGDFFQVRGTATVQPTLATAETSEALPPNLAWLWSRWSRYTDVRVATRTAAGEVGLWLGASFNGTDISGYLGVLTAALEIAIYRVDVNVPTLLAISIPIDMDEYPLAFQRVGSTLTLFCPDAPGGSITATDSTYGAGYVGFGSIDGTPGAEYNGFEITQPR